jgi:hypothetical protein
MDNEDLEPLMTSKITRQRFTNEEDDLIRHAVEQHGTDDWKLIILVTGVNRNPKQVRERYWHYLNPETPDLWTKEQLAQLEELRDQYGNRWAAIGRLIGKPAIQVRNQARRSDRRSQTITPKITPQIILPTVQPTDVSRSSSFDFDFGFGFGFEDPDGSLFD